MVCIRGWDKDKNENMKIVNILGGLGNQMFEYAMFLALKDAHPNEELKVCTRSFVGYGLHNGLEIQRIFGVVLPEASLRDLAKLAYPFFNYKTWQVMRHWLPNRKTMTRGALGIPFDYSEIERETSTYYEGYWQNEKNFRHIREHILKVYTFPNFDEERNIKLASRLVECNALSCHIRRGDYLKEPAWCVCKEEYYMHAISRALEEKQIDLLCVFSDDIEWCRENLNKVFRNVDKVYVDWNKGEKSFRDMQLMTLCRHNVIANSSFSWWGAWLGTQSDKVVYCPEIWVNGDVKNDPICDNWVRIKTEL